MIRSGNPVRVVAVTGGKGGIGKTSVSVNLGVALAAAGRRVTLLDADLGLANVDILLGLKPRRTLEDVLRGDATLADVLVAGPGGLRVVPAASGTVDMVRLGLTEHAAMIRAFSDIAHQMDTLIVDTAAGISDVVTSFLSAAGEVVIVACNEPASITDAYALIKVLSRHHGIGTVRVLANMVRSAGDGEQVFANLVTVAERFLDVRLKYAGWIPYDDHLRRAVKRQRAVVELYPRSHSATAFRRLAEAVGTWPAPSASRGCLEFFVEQLVMSKDVPDKAIAV